ncbi:hypothetical protein RRG08_043110 [Elysia crispata]|uniref:Uncharacterized protein n=1 Tax=Elysia crispata TaxID=231223 RepID=A0AAE0XYN4_9GAST|nr:hypothetical protein RRG08_043110 [Elysia crispata]
MHKHLRVPNSSRIYVLLPGQTKRTRNVLGSSRVNKSSDNNRLDVRLKYDVNCRRPAVRFYITQEIEIGSQEG